MPTTIYPSSHPCKLCNLTAQAKHTIQDIPYYYCSDCTLLFNTYWDNKPPLIPEQIAVNDKRREERWPAGEADHMYEKGWETLECMGWPVAWWSRQVHARLKKIPAYQTWVHRSIKRRFQKVLDFGCGHGISVTELRNRDGMNVIGLDPFSPIYEPYIIRTPLITHRFDSEIFDAIFSIETLEHIPNILEIFRELHRILKPGGVLLVQTRRLEDTEYKAKQDKWFYLEGPTTHVSIYSEAAMRTIADKTGWDSVSFRGVRYALFKKAPDR
ncbi:MAG: class I SAM-dependent methyltransferase [bacterium]|nr:class I SAM-dependent methyltransferase [bacterium]